MYNENQLKNKKNAFFNKLFRKRTRRLFNNFEKKFNQVVNINIIIGFVCILTGLLLFLLYGLNVKVVAYILAVYILIWSLNAFYASRSKEYNLFKCFNIYAVAGLIDCIFLFFTKNIGLSLSIWILIEAFVKLNFSLQFKKINLPSWVVLVSYAIFLLLFAILTFINPLKRLTTPEFVGVILILVSILNLTSLNLVKTIAVDYLNDF